MLNFGNILTFYLNLAMSLCKYDDNLADFILIIKILNTKKNIKKSFSYEFDLRIMIH